MDTDTMIVTVPAPVPSLATDLIEPVVHNFQIEFGTPTKFVFDMLLKNTSSTPVSVPIYVSINDLQPGPPTVTIANADNGEGGVGAEYDYSHLVGSDQILTPGELSEPRLWVFNNPTFASFSFTAAIYGVHGSAPMAKTAVSGRGTTEGSHILFVDAKNKQVHILDDYESYDALVMPKAFALEQNYPNPFNPETTIKYQLPEPARVMLAIFNLKGQEIRTLVDEEKPAGYYSIVWDSKDNIGRDASSGLYVYRLQACRFVEIKKMLLLR
jgi:hypothetical protein